MDCNKKDNSSDVEESLIDLTKDIMNPNTTLFATANISRSDDPSQNEIVPNNYSEKETLCNATEIQTNLDDDKELREASFSETDISVSAFEDFSEDFSLFDDNILEHQSHQ